MAKILLIDDDPDFIETYTVILEKNGYEVLSAFSGADGLAKIRQDVPDLVLLDVMMSTEYEGFEVAKKVREEMNLRDLPIVILSSIHAEKQVPYRFAPNDTYLPVDFWLDKPVEPNALLDVVRKALGDMPSQPG